MAEEVTPPEDVTAPEVLALAGDFPPADRDQWQALVAAVLRKRDNRTGQAAADESAESIQAALGQSLGSGIEVAPLYVAEDAAELATDIGVPGLPPFVRGGRAGYGELTGWDVRARHAHPDVDVTKQAISIDLDNGVTSLWLVFGSGALPADSLPEVLAEVLLDVAPVVLQADSNSEQLAEGFLELASERHVKPGALVGNLGADAFGPAIRSGTDPDLGATSALARRCAADYPTLRSIVVDGTVFHDAGAGAVEELGCALAAGAEYLRALVQAGCGIDDAFGQLEFRYAATADQFLTIAALRAARRLWNRVGEECGASPVVRGQRQHAVTSSVMMSRRDPWVNMLRTTVACFAAGVGGADAVTVLPFDYGIGLPDPLSRRIARNTQTLLMEEGHLARVLDPAGGSWYVEELSEQLANLAWDWFTEIERAGGLSAALSAGLVAERIAEVWAVRRDRLAHRHETLVGVSDFPNPSERLPVREPHPEPPAADHSNPSLPTVRAAGDYEALRDAVDAAAAQGDARPSVFLARLGSPAESTARVTFAKNLFGAAGLLTPDNDEDSEDDEEIAASFADARTSVACICGPDAAYEWRVGPLATALREAGARLVWIAAPPQVAADIGGIDGHVFAGCDALAVLTRTLDELGLTQAGGDRS